MKTSTTTIILASIGGIFSIGHLINIFIIVLGWKFVVAAYNYFD